MLDFSYTNLVRLLPVQANHVLECLFASSTKLSRSEMCELLGKTSDEVAIGVQALIKTSLVIRQTDDNVEWYGLSGSIRDLFLRNPASEETRTAVFARLAERHQVVSAIRTGDRNDPLDSYFIPTDYGQQFALTTFRAFQAVRKRESKATLANMLEQVRALLVDQPVPELYRAAALLLVALNDRNSAKRMLQHAEATNAIDPAGRLMLAELYKNDKQFEECLDVSQKLDVEKWFANGQTDRANLARLSKVTWLIMIWRGRPMEVIAKVKDWKQNDDLRAIKASIFVEAIRKLMEPETARDKFCPMIEEAMACIMEVFDKDGYVGFVVGETVKLIETIGHKLGRADFQSSTIELLIKFAATHLGSVCQVHDNVDLESLLIRDFVELVSKQAKALKISDDIPATPLAAAIDPALRDYNYVAVRIYSWPKDSLGNRRTFCFARDVEGIEYHVAKRTFDNEDEFWKLDEQDIIHVLPRPDFDENRARPVKHSMLS